MILQDAVTNLILVMNKFITKNGSDVDSRRELVDAINAVTGENSLDAVFINNVDNYIIPDVAVLHLYNEKFSDFLMNPDVADLCPFGYTIEIHKRCFTKYTAEELTAAVLHDVLQNVQSDTARVRFLKAYTAVMTKHNHSKVLDLFDDISFSEVAYIAFTEICLRPFRVPVEGQDYTGTDDALNVMGLADAYDSYLGKMLQMSNSTVEQSIEKELQQDYRDVNTIIKACLDHDIRHYYNVIREAAPLVSMDNLLGSRQAVNSLGFISRKKEYKRRRLDDINQEKVITETYNDPKTELEIRFKIDQIISSMRYAESEAEREVILFRIKQLSLKLAKQDEQLSKKKPMDDKTSARIVYIKNAMDELDALREKTVNMEIKVKRWSVYAKDAMPAGYDF